MSAWRSVFEAYGVCFEVETNRPDRIAPLLQRLPLSESPQDRRCTATFRLDFDDAGAPSQLLVNGVPPADELTAEAPLSWRFDSLVTLHIALQSPFVFVHAGMVGYRGQGMLFPGRSFAGKTTLTAALLALGADYYSDDFAVITEDGSVLPYHCPLQMRTPTGRVDAGPHDFHAQAAYDPVRPALVVATHYQPGATWQPRTVSAGEGLLRMLEHAVAAQSAPERVCRVLSCVAQRAACLTGPRGDADETARLILDYFDSLSVAANHSSLHRQVHTCCR